MRAIVREILARRQPHPPEEFVAIQVSRLNEALLVAYSAMSITNLRAVDRVVRIVRELDRYHGFVAAERRLPEPKRIGPPTEAPLAFGPALVCRAEFAPDRARACEERGDEAIGAAVAPHGDGLLRCARNAGVAAASRPGNPVQHLDKADSAPGIPLARQRDRSEAVHASHAPSDLLDRPIVAPRPPATKTLESSDRSQSRAAIQANVEDAPASGSPRRFAACDDGRRSFLPGPAFGRDDCPENPAQRLDKVDSAPGIPVDRHRGWSEAIQGPHAPDVRPVAAPRPLATTLLGSSDNRQGDASMPAIVERPATRCFAARDDRRDSPSPSPASGPDGRPEIPAQRLDKVDSAPSVPTDRHRERSEAIRGPHAPHDRPVAASVNPACSPISAPSAAPRFRPVRMLQNGAAAC
jgi:hypothetical protein